MTEPRILSVCWLPQQKLKLKPDKIAGQELLQDENGHEAIDNEDDSENELEFEEGLCPKPDPEKVQLINTLDYV